MISIKNIFFALAGLAYLGIGYIATTVPHPPLITVFLGLAPFSVAAIVTIWNANARLPLLLLCAACVGAIVMNIDTLRNHVAWLYFIQHAGTMALLCITFGSTLGSSHEAALCSRIAAVVVPEPLDKDYLFYTWKVTLAWTIYFAVSSATSILLFFLAPVEIWSVFANLLTPVSLGVMFVGEYLIRIRLMPDAPRVSVTATIHAYQKYSQQQNTR